MQKKVHSTKHSSLRHHVWGFDIITRPEFRNLPKIEIKQRNTQNKTFEEHSNLKTVSDLKCLELDKTKSYISIWKAHLFVAQHVLVSSSSPIFKTQGAFTWAKRSQRTSMSDLILDQMLCVLCTKQQVNDWPELHAVALFWVETNQFLVFLKFCHVWQSRKINLEKPLNWEPSQIWASKLSHATSQRINRQHTSQNWTLQNQNRTKSVGWIGWEEINDSWSPPLAGLWWTASTDACSGRGTAGDGLETKEHAAELQNWGGSGNLKWDTFTKFYPQIVISFSGVQVLLWSRPAMTCSKQGPCSV